MSENGGQQFDSKLIYAIIWGKRIVAAVLLVAMMAMVLAATAQLFVVMLADILSLDPGIQELFAEDKLLGAFGVFLTVLIALEFIETVEAYLTDGYVRADLVVLIAVIALGRKIVLHDPYSTDPLLLIGMAALVLGLGATFYLIRRGGTYEPHR